jgi:uncharacterized protein YegL
MDQIIAILDRSYSMMGSEKATIDGYNEFIHQQVAISDKAVVSLILFDDKYEEVYTSIKIDQVPDLNRDIYFVRGSTALNDAIAKSIAIAENYEKWHDVDKTIVAIFTDGMENASKETTAELVKTRVKSLEEDKKWEFIYVGCDHDVFQAAQNLGVKSVNTVQFNKSNLKSSLVGEYSNTVAFYRTSDD